MKRSSNAMEGHRDKQPRRQEPVSCQFCRTKKLKCDRQFPCSNCGARKLTCASSSGTSQAASQISGAPDTSTFRNEPSQNIDELNARLQRLEELLASKGDLPHEKEYAAVLKNESEGEDFQVSRDMNWLEADTFEHETIESPFLTSDEQIGHIFSASFLSFTATTLRPTMDKQTLSLLPSRAQAGFLFDYYIEEIMSLYHLIHVPTVRRMIDTVYTQLENNEQPPYDHVALLSSIFALSAYFASPSSRFHFKGREGKSFCYRWIFVAQRALLAADYIVAPTLETLQSTILISQHLLPNIGAMATFRTLMATALLGARSLGLHRILAFMSGSQCGTYMINPKHMQVDTPTNVNDADITSSGDYAKPFDDLPTDMTYYIMRVRISIIFREIVDAANDSGGSFEDIPYDLVLAFDRKLNDAMKAVPFWFKLDPKSRARSKEIDKRFPKLPLQRLMGHFGAQTRFARLHRPYLARGARDPKYAYSRMICLRSARSVIEMGKEMTHSGQEFEQYKLWTMIHHFSVSVLVLVMDYCLNREEPRADERKAEILDCFKMLERAQEESTVARRALQQLKELLSNTYAKSDSGSKDKSSPILANANLPHPNSQNHQIQQGIMPPLIMTSNRVPQVDNRVYFQPGHEVVEPLPQYNWSETDFNSMGDLSFDVDLNENQFEMIFRSLEGNEPMY